MSTTLLDIHVVQLFITFSKLLFGLRPKTMLYEAINGHKMDINGNKTINEALGSEQTTYHFCLVLNLKDLSYTGLTVTCTYFIWVGIYKSLTDMMKPYIYIYSGSVRN